MADPTKPSRYTPVWEKLKQDRKVELIIVPALAKRIVKAVQKRRDLDLLYKYQLAESRKRARIYWELKANKLTLKLKLWLLSPEDI